jgi:hypothetical protein
VGARLATAQLSAKDIEAAAQAAEQKAMAKIAAEQAENKKARMPSFWLPSLAPEAVNGKSQVKEKDVKLQTVCLYGDEPHPFSYVYLRLPALCQMIRPWCEYGWFCRVELNTLYRLATLVAY